MATKGSEIVANELMISLLENEVIDLPTVNLNDPIYIIPGDINSAVYKEVVRLTNEELTTGSIEGTGTFDALMRGFKSHLREEYEKERISGGEYTKAYIALTEGAMSNAVQYLLGRDASYWSAVTAQAQAITARLNLETAKVQYVSVLAEMLNNKANFALTKLKLATEDINFAIAKYNLDSMLPSQKSNVDAQASYTTTQTIGQVTLNEGYVLDNTGKGTANDIAAYQRDSLLPQQYKLLIEQTQSARAQTADNRDDIPSNPAATGVLGKQKDLYTQQIASYQRNDEVRAGKIWTDAWTVMKTVDEDAEAPNEFTKVRIDEILGKLKIKNDLST